MNAQAPKKRGKIFWLNLAIVLLAVFLGTFLTLSQLSSERRTVEIQLYDYGTSKPLPAVQMGYVSPSPRGGGLRMLRAADAAGKIIVSKDDLYGNTDVRRVYENLKNAVTGKKGKRSFNVTFELKGFRGKIFDLPCDPLPAKVIIYMRPDPNWAPATYTTQNTIGEDVTFTY
jgi:hypothetical protein